MSDRENSPAQILEERLRLGAGFGAGDRAITPKSFTPDGGAAGLLVPSHAGRHNRVMHLVGRAGTYTPPEGGESNHWIVHMNSDALSLGTYSIPAGGTDDQEPHTEDEVYVVQAGRAALVTASGTVAVEPGSVVFVPAGETHKFTDITKDLALVVIFAPRYGSRTRR